MGNQVESKDLYSPMLINSRERIKSYKNNMPFYQEVIRQAKSFYDSDPKSNN